NWRDPGWLQTERHPVVNVTWHDAVAFCEWLSQKEGRNYRLPTEAEWEYACRAGSEKAFVSGETQDDLRGYANTADASLRRVFETFRKKDYHDYSQPWNDGFPFTAPVGQFKPNAWGLFDMQGNASEWCTDWYADDYFLHSPADDPPGPETGDHR